MFFARNSLGLLKVILSYDVLLFEILDRINGLAKWLTEERMLSLGTTSYYPVFRAFVDRYSAASDQ